MVDDVTLKALRAALLASPGNVDLRLVVAQALADRDDIDGARSLLRGVTVEDYSTAKDELAAPRLLLATGDGATALALLAGATSPEALALRALAHADAGSVEHGRADYLAAVAANATLEDSELARRLDAEPRPILGGGDRPRLRVIANDDTDALDLDRLLAPDEAPVTFADVGGMDGIKEHVRRRIILPFQSPSLFQRFRRRVGGGILLYGPPGCGKTLLARATAGECGAAFLNVAISDVLDMYVGESERKLHALFEKARATAPSVLFFDEIEALGARRQYGREATTAKLVSQFLAEMDGFGARNQGVLVLGATNVPWALDPAFRRPGRFDRTLFVPPPDRGARRVILDLHLADLPVEASLPLDDLARTTSGFSGADLRHLVETAADEAIAESMECGREVPIGRAHLKRSHGQVKATTLEWLTTARNHARYANEGGQYDEVLDFLRRHGKG